MKALKLFCVLIIGFIITLSGYSTEHKRDRKQDKEKAQRERTIQLSLYITDIDTNPIDGALVSYDKNSMTGFSTNEMGELVILCENYDTLYITKENYIGQIIPVNNRYELNVVLEKIPEDLLPAKDSTEKK